MSKLPPNQIYYHHPHKIQSFHLNGQHKVQLFLFLVFEDIIRIFLVVWTYRPNNQVNPDPSECRRRERRYGASKGPPEAHRAPSPSPGAPMPLRRLRGRLGARARSLLGGRARRCGWVGSGAKRPVGVHKRLIGAPTPSLGAPMSLRRARVRRCVYGVSLFARV